MLRELQPDIRRYARRQCHRTTAIEDVVQEALIVLYRRLGTVRNPLAIAGWIFRVVTRLCLLPVLGLIRGAEELTERHEAQYFAQFPKDELRIDVVRALESLPDIYREDDFDDDPDACPKFVQALPASVRSYVTVTVYPGVGHGFDVPKSEERTFQDPLAHMGHGGSVRYYGDAATADKARAFAVEFFKSNLKAK
jgi:hypothetical protein